MVHNTWGLVIASGRSEQLESGLADAAFLNLGGKPVLYYAMAAFEQCPDIDRIAVVASKDRLLDIQQMTGMFGFTKVRKLIAGGKSRASIVKSSLKVLEEPEGYVALLEVTRPLANPSVIADCVRKARRFGCAQAAAPVRGVIKSCSKTAPASRNYEGDPLWQLQAPLVCGIGMLETALAQADAQKLKYRDETELLEQCGQEIRLSPDIPWNFKITSSDELGIAEGLLRVGVNTWAVS